MPFRQLPDYIQWCISDHLKRKVSLQPSSMIVGEMSKMVNGNLTKQMKEWRWTWSLEQWEAIKPLKSYCMNIRISQPMAGCTPGHNASKNHQWMDVTSICQKTRDFQSFCNVQAQRQPQTNSHSAKFCSFCGWWHWLKCISFYTNCFKMVIGWGCSSDGRALA